MALHRQQKPEESVSTGSPENTAYGKPLNLSGCVNNSTDTRKNQEIQEEIWKTRKSQEITQNNKEKLTLKKIRKLEKTLYLGDTESLD